MDLELRHLRAVVAIAKRGSITGAAAELELSQPALTAQLQRMEAALGGVLFERSHRGVTPTALGELVLASAASIVRESEALADDIAKWTRLNRAVIRIGGNASPVFGRIVAELQEILPCEIVRFVDMSSTNVSEKLLRHELDVAFLGVHRGHDAEGPDSLCERVVVETSPFLLAISTEHPLASQADIALADLADEDWLLPPGRPDGTLAALLDACAHAGFEPRAPLGAAGLNEQGSYVAEGRAVAVCLPTAVLEHGIAAVPLRGVPIAGRLVLRWWEDRVDPDVIDLMWRTAGDQYVRRLMRTAAQQPWWHVSPGHRPTLTPGLAPLLEAAIAEADGPSRQVS